MQHSRGFTLIELMVTLVVVAILLATGIPSFASFIRNNRATAQANEFITAANIARTEAVKRGTFVTLCASTDGGTCSAAVNWATGWVLLDSAANPIQTWGALNNNSTFAATAATIQYLDTGFQSAGPITFTLQVDNCTDNQGRTITIGRTGHAGVQDLSC